MRFSEPEIASILMYVFDLIYQDRKKIIRKPNLTQRQVANTLRDIDRAKEFLQLIREEYLGEKEV